MELKIGICDDDAAQVTTFLEKSYDVLVNGNDRVFGIPVLIKENAAGEISELSREVQQII